MHHQLQSHMHTMHLMIPVRASFLKAIIVYAMCTCMAMPGFLAPTQCLCYHPWVCIHPLLQVSYEFVACQSDNAGVLVLSEFAGAAQSLGAGALLVNPWNIRCV